MVFRTPIHEGKYIGLSSCGSACSGPTCVWPGIFFR